MTATFILIAIAIASYPCYFLLRWRRARINARQAIDSLAAEIIQARNRVGDNYNQLLRFPELLDQLVSEIYDLSLALEGTMMLSGLVTFKQKLRLQATSDFRWVVEQADRGIQELKNAAFLAQFPTGSRLLEKAILNGIPVRER